MAMPPTPARACTSIIAGAAALWLADRRNRYIPLGRKVLVPQGGVADRRRRRVALRTRTFLATAVTLAVLFLALFGAVSSITERSFGTLEARDGAAAATRIVQAVRAELSRLQSVSGDWAPWDDTYQYVAGEYPEYPTDNLMTDALANLRADVFVIADASGRILFAGGSDLEGGGERDLPADLAAACATAARTAPLATLEATGGILQTRQGALLVAVHPITNNALDAPANGWLLVGRFLDAAEITALSQTTGLTTTVYLPSGSNPADVAGAVGRLAASGSDRAVAPLNDDLLATYVQMPLFGGGGTAIIRGVADRSAYRESRNTLGLFAAAFIAAGLVLVAANLIVLDRSVLRRLKNLSSFLHRVEAAGVEARVPVEGTDELTSIERNINSMLDALDT
ncbi:MAG: HAMP domain-containing protein, partial [Actinobacteria bacterium]